MAVKRYTPIHEIEFRRESGSPSDPDSEVVEAIVGSARADRRDMRAMETGGQGSHYFKTQTIYTVPARVLATVTADHGGIAALGEQELGSAPMGLPPDPGKTSMGSEPEPDWIVYDRARKRRYRIVGKTQSDDLKRYKLFTEEVR